MAMNMNKVIISGTVIEDPQIVGQGDDAWAFFKMITNYGQRNPDGSFSDVDQVCQIVADVPHHVNTARNYIKTGKALAVDGYYRTWETQEGQMHGFFVRSFTFAKANWGAEQNNNGGGGNYQRGSYNR